MAKKVVLKTAQELLDDTRTELAVAKSEVAQYQRFYRAEDEANAKLRSEMAVAKDKVSRAENEAEGARYEARQLLEQLQFARGYIAAMKGEAYPAEPKPQLNPWDVR